MFYRLYIVYRAAPVCTQLLLYRTLSVHFYRKECSIKKIKLFCPTFFYSIHIITEIPSLRSCSLPFTIFTPPLFAFASFLPIFLFCSAARDTARDFIDMTSHFGGLPRLPPPLRTDKLNPETERRRRRGRRRRGNIYEISVKISLGLCPLWTALFFVCFLAVLF